MDQRRGELQDHSHTWTDTIVQDMPAHPQCCFCGCRWLTCWSVLSPDVTCIASNVGQGGFLPTLWSTFITAHSFVFSFFFFFLLFFSFLALPPPTQFYWDITEIKHCISSHYTMWWFHTHIYCEVITTIINTSITSHRYQMCVCVHVPVWWGHLRSSLLATIMQYREL